MPQSLYATLARDLRSAIIAGEYDTGSLLPGELELARQHGVSRATARAALGLLQQQGLVERRRGDGTRVLPARPNDSLGQSVTDVAELISYAAHTRRIIQSAENVVIDQDQTARLNFAPGSRWLKLYSLRVDPHNPSNPICYSKSYIAAEIADVASLHTNETTALCDLLHTHKGVVLGDVTQEIAGGPHSLRSR